MSTIPYTPPKFKAKSFNCPMCNAFARQIWRAVYYSPGGGGFVQADDFQLVYCEHCEQFSVWQNGRMVSPNNAPVMPPNVDLRKDIQEDYNEARAILMQSPRGSAALLRLCIQKLCQQLGLPGKDLDADIGKLVSDGLPVSIQKALDIVRLIGNKSVHPGVLDIKDDVGTSSKLFELVNHIAYSMITQPNEIGALYSAKIPESQKEHIESRNEKARTPKKPSG